MVENVARYPLALSLVCYVLSDFYRSSSNSMKRSPGVQLAFFMSFSGETYEATARCGFANPAAHITLLVRRKAE